MPPVWLKVKEPLPVVLVTWPAAVVSDVAAVPVLTVSKPLVVIRPPTTSVLLPVTPKVTPPLAVTVLVKSIPPPEVLRLKEPEPKLMAEESLIFPPAETVSELGVPDIVPRARLALPCVIVVAPVPVIFTVSTFVVTPTVPLPALNESVPVEDNSPDPLIVPAPLVANEMPPLAVVPPLSEIALPLLAVNENEPLPSPFVFN